MRIRALYKVIKPYICIKLSLNIYKLGHWFIEKKGKNDIERN
jgi:hypothetical protein